MMRKRMLALLLLFLIVGMAFPAAADNPHSPGYYVLRGKYVDEISANSLQEAIAEADGEPLIVDGGRISLKGNITAKGKILLNNATLELQQGKYEFYELPSLYGASSMVVAHGAQVYEKKKDGKMVIGRSGDNCYLGLEKGATYIETAIKEKNPALRISAPLLVAKAIKEYSAARRYVYNGGIQIKSATFATAPGSVLHIGRDATLTIDKSSAFYLMGATVLNEGKIENKGRLLIYREVLAPASAARLQGYEFYQYVGGSGQGTAFENKGMLTSTGVMQIMRGAFLTNTGILYEADILNAGTLRNAGHIERAKILGNAIISQSASKEYIVALQQKGAPEFTYVTCFTVGKGNNLTELELPGKARLFKDPNGTRQWDPKKDFVTEDILLYVGD